MDNILWNAGDISAWPAERRPFFASLNDLGSEADVSTCRIQVVRVDVKPRQMPPSGKYRVTESYGD